MGLDDTANLTNINISTLVIIYVLAVNSTVGLNIMQMSLPATPPLAPLSMREGEVPWCSL
jgi:hypothetical protein